MHEWRLERTRRLSDSFKLWQPAEKAGYASVEAVDEKDPLPPNFHLIRCYKANPIAIEIVGLLFCL